MFAADPGAGEHPSSQEVLVALYAGARESRNDYRAAPFAVYVKANGADAVRIELGHREGTALAVVVPYTRNRFKKRVTLGQFTVFETSKIPR